MSFRKFGQHPRRSALAMALAVGMGFTGITMAQVTTGTIFGVAPAGGGTITVASPNGTSRTVTVGTDGRYTIGNLPLGTYTVTLKQDGQTVATRNNVNIRVGAGIEVPFVSTDADAQNLAAIEVTANALPSIDVTSVSSSTVITAQQLEQLPISHNAESIALLAPGTVAGSGYFSRSVSFGGAGVTENAYYVNGFNTTDLYNYTGATYQLPYGAIAQQQIYTGGYSAKYGRSDGGVINQVGKRGTNEWHYGARATWQPRALQSSPKNLYYPHIEVPAGYELADESKPGTLRRYRNANKSWSTEYAAYIGGPLIEDKLFFYFAGEYGVDSNRSVAGVDSQRDAYYKNRDTKYYAKVDWNINENNVFEYTRMFAEEDNGYGTNWTFDNETRQDGQIIGERSYNHNTIEGDILHYTSYLTDEATLSVLYGRMQRSNPIVYPEGSDKPYIYAPGAQNPAYWTNGRPIVNDQTDLYTYSNQAKSSSNSLRVDFSYRLGDHLLQAGIDNVNYAARNQGQFSSGPGYTWIYSQGAADENINEKLNVGKPGSTYFVDKYVIDFKATMSAKQKAYYIQDNWQVSDNMLVELGLRNDRFTNYNNAGQAFVDQRNQWEPRLGMSWDVFGDSSLKVYGNLGRYYLALPQAVAERSATASTFTDQYFTYTGIDSNGVPTGLVPVPTVDGDPAGPGPVTANNERGQNKDPNVVVATDLKAQYQDELILGFDKTLGTNWVYGASATYRHLDTTIDDTCDMDRIGTKLEKMGLNPDDYAWGNPGCRIFNPGKTNTFQINSLTGGRPVTVSMTKEDWGIKKGPVRKYYALDMYLEHPFSNNWYGRIDYTFSRSWGNAEGQVRSDIGQTDSSATEDWDFASLMDGGYGYLANHRRHQVKIRGAYQPTPEWLFSGTLRVQSGTPNSCLGYYGPDGTGDPSGYGPDYHWCFGQQAHPGGEGLGMTPWTKQLNLAVRYTPAFADQKLAITMDVFNVLNEQKALQTDPSAMAGKGYVSNTYGAGIYFEQPRYIRLSVSYDY
ncbi:MAG TPA: TonB-dependent receptor [Oleiagrimonas sp.]|nr:TonB-dependent receptor [Oleiagrimonas sp.]